MPRSPLLSDLTPFPKILFTLLLILCCFFLILIPAFLLAVPLFGIPAGEIVTGLNDFSNPGMIDMLKYFQIVQEIGLFLLPPLIAALLFSSAPLDYLKLSRASRWQAWILTLLIMVVCLPWMNWMITLNESMVLPEWLEPMERWMKETEQKALEITKVFLDVYTTGGFLMNLLMIAILPALGEELLFRGLLQRLFSEWFGNIHLAILLAGFLFGAMHLQFYGILPRMILGMLFGYLFYWSGSIWIPVFAHFLNNGAAVTLSYLGNIGWTDLNYETFGSTTSPVWIMTSLLLTAAAIYTFRAVARNRIPSVPNTTLNR